VVTVKDHDPWERTQKAFVKLIEACVAPDIRASDPDDLDSDAVFGVKNMLVHEFIRHDSGLWRQLKSRFRLKPGKFNGGPAALRV